MGRILDRRIGIRGEQLGVRPVIHCDTRGVWIRHIKSARRTSRTSG